MSGSVDSKVVSLQFDNAQFEQGVKESLASIESLNQSLNKMGGSASFGKIDKGAQNASGSLANVEASVGNIESRFTTMGIIGATVLQNLTNKAVNLFTKIAHQTISGGMTRALNIEQARFQMEGLKMDVEAMMGEDGPVQKAVKGTAYGLDEAAKAASMLGASGIKDMSKMEGYLRGIAGAAAMSGRDFSSTADIFTTVASNGKLMTQQLRQFSFSGLNVAATMAKYFKEVRHESGMTEEKINDMVTKGKIDFETFADAMEWAFADQAAQANKTFTGAMANVKAALGRIGGDLFGGSEGNNGLFENIRYAIIGDKKNLKDAVGLIGLIDSIRKVLQPVTFAMNDLTMGIAKNAYKTFSNLAAKVNDIRGAFYNLNKDGDFVSFKDGPMLGLVRIGENLKKIFGQLMPIFGALGKLLGRVAALGISVFEKLTKHLAESGIIKKFADLVVKLVDVIINAGGGLLGLLGGIGAALIDVFFGAANLATKGADKFAGVIKRISEGFDALMGKIKELSKGRSGIDIVNMLHLAALTIGFKKLGRLMMSIKGNIENILKNELFKRTGLLGRVNQTFVEMKDTFVAYQRDIKARAIIRIAVAIGIMAASIYVLSKIPTKDLAKSLGAIEILMITLTFFMRELTSIAGKQFKIKEITASISNLLGMFAMTYLMIGFAGTVLILAKAVAELGKLDEGEIKRGLAATLLLMGGMLGVIEAASRINMGALKGGQLFGMAAVMLAMAEGVKILANAVSQMASLNNEELIKGLGGVITLIGGMMIPLLGLSQATSKLNFKTQFIGIAIGLLAFAGAIKILSNAVVELSALKPDELARGLVGVGVAFGIMLGGLIGLMKFMAEMSKLKKGFGFLNSASVVSMAAGMLMLAVGVRILAESVGTLGQLDMATIGKGLLALAGTMAIMIATINLTPPLKILGVAAGFMGLSIAMNLLATAISRMGELDPETSIKGLGIMLGVIAGFGMVSTILGPAIRSMLLLGAAMNLIGLGLMSISGGLVAFTTAISIVIRSVSAAKSAMINDIGSVVKVFASIGKTIGSFLAGLVAGIIDALPGIMDQIIAGITGMVSKFVELIAKIATVIFDAIAQYVGPIVSKLLEILGIVFESIANGLGPIVEGLIMIVIAIIEKFAAAIMEHKDQILDAFENIVNAIVNLLIGLVFRLPRIAGNMIVSLANGAWKNRGKVVDVFKKLGTVILTAVTNIPGKLVNIGKRAINAIKSGAMSKYSDLRAWFGKLPGRIKDALAGLPGKLLQAGKNAIQGFINGLTSGNVASVAAGLGSRVLTHLKKKLGIKSPSRELAKVGRYAIEGFVKGINGESSNLQDAAESSALTLMSSLQSALDAANEVMSDSMNPVITPVVDLSSAQAGASLLNGMFSSQYAMGVGASMSQSRSAMENLKESIVNGVKDAISIQSEAEANRTYKFEAPITLDGREVARATATYTQDELDKIQARNNRQLGLV